jgi:hypothetical protein
LEFTHLGFCFLSCNTRNMPGSIELFIRRGNHDAESSDYAPNSNNSAEKHPIRLTETQILF